jgi:Mrp family chromosome partitioning ATPase
MNMGRPMGLAEALAAGSLLAYIAPTDAENLSILPVGTARSSAAAVVTPAAVARLIGQAREHFDIILIDTGPILGSIEASPVTVAADGVILTVSRGQSRPQVERALSHLLSIGARLAGIVFNRAQHSDFQRSLAQLSMDRMPSGNGHATAGA